uniref:Uncharacterized protein n=1 Tax=Nothobranchius kuhntae TaxID=321403 RepID=A0A1A8JX24_NOTKU
MHFLFHNVPARREDFTKLTGSSLFPLPFCGHKWVENLPVGERAIEVWPKLKESMLKREGARRGLKRKALEDELEQLKKKKEISTS